LGILEHILKIYEIVEWTILTLADGFESAYEFERKFKIKNTRTMLPVQNLSSWLSA
jgi:hypothetical protein